jgi:hypothetical protein
MLSIHEVGIEAAAASLAGFFEVPWPISLNFPFIISSLIRSAQGTHTLIKLLYPLSLFYYYLDKVRSTG